MLWPMPRMRTSAAAQAMPTRQSDPGAGQSALVDMHHAVWPAPRIRTAASNSLPIGDPGARPCKPMSLPMPCPCKLRDTCAWVPA